MVAFDCTPRAPRQWRPIRLVVAPIEFVVEEFVFLELLGSERFAVVTALIQLLKTGVPTTQYEASSFLDKRTHAPEELAGSRSPG